MQEYCIADVNNDDAISAFEMSSMMSLRLWFCKSCIVFAEKKTPTLTSVSKTANSCPRSARGEIKIERFDRF